MPMAMLVPPARTVHTCLGTVALATRMCSRVWTGLGLTAIAAGMSGTKNTSAAIPVVNRRESIKPCELEVRGDDA